MRRTLPPALTRGSIGYGAADPHELSASDCPRLHLKQTVRFVRDGRAAGEVCLGLRRHASTAIWRGWPANRTATTACARPPIWSSALLDADGRLSDAELRAWIEDVGSLLTPPVIVTPQRLRDGDMLAGTATWIQRPSTLFDLLLKADVRDGERRANRYYDVALKLAHATAAIDLVPSPDEIGAIDRFRSTLLQAMDSAGIPRPGQPAVAAAHRCASGRHAAAAGAPTGASVGGTARRARRADRARPCEGGDPPPDEPADGSRRSAPTRDSRPSRRATTSCSPATRAPARPPSPGS